METGMTDKKQGRHTDHLRTQIAAGYILILLLVGGIVHLWVGEWRKLETFETENHRINALRMEVHDVYVRVVELSLLGETVLEWEEANVEEYRDKRQAVDSLLCRFKNIYPAERIDSVRRLLEDKEKQLCGIMRVLDEQEDINERIAERVPVIAWKSTQEEPKKTKRKGLFGIFGKREKPEPTATTTMLYTLNRDMITQQKAQSRRLSDHADSLAARNAELNHQLQTLIKQMDKKVQTDLLRREAEITSMRERSFMQIGGLTGFILLLLIMSYIIIHRYARRISRYRRETTSLIAQLSESNSMNGKLTATRQKTMYTITHELRTPLTAIKGWAETLCMENDPQTIQKGVHVIVNETERLSQMVEELLDFSRMQSGRFSLQPATMDILAELGDAVLIYAEKAKRENIRMIYHEPERLPFVYGDKHRIRQVFINIIDNAIKYSNPGCMITVGAEQVGDKIQVTITDNGCGISEADLPRVKTKFFKANHSRRGSGIGLAVADEIIANHGGSLKITSELGVGTCVTITLPIEQPGEKHEQEA